MHPDHPVNNHHPRSPRSEAAAAVQPFHVGRLLAATPKLDDPNFERAVVLLLDHDDDGALGVVLNRPSTIPVTEVLGSWADAAADPAVVFGGGPVEPTALVAIGRATAQPSATDGWTPLFERLRLVNLEDDPELAREGLVSLRIFSGYAGWSPAQLEQEIIQGAWFPLDATPPDVFSPRPELLWQQVLARQQGSLRMYAHYPEDPSWN